VDSAGRAFEASGTTQLVTVGTAAAVPLRRLGTLLRDARLLAGDDLEAVALRSEGRYDTIDLHAIEAGEYRLTDDEVTELLDLYRADPGELLASRSTLVIDLDEGTVAAGNWTISFAPGADGPDDILARYLALLYEMRGLEPGTAIPLRSLDVSVLSEALAMPARAVEERLEILMVPGNRRLEQARRLLRRRVLVPAAGLVIAATAAGVLLFSPSADHPTVGSQVGRAVGTEAQSALAAPIVAADPDVEFAPPGVDTTPEIGEGLTIERTDTTLATDTAPSVAPSASTGPPDQVPAPIDVGEPEIGEGLTIEAPPQIAPPGVDTTPEIGEGLTIERTD
jgi:hypothetical protein